MRILVPAALALALVLAPARARGEEPAPAAPATPAVPAPTAPVDVPGEITWYPTVASAFAAGKAATKPVFVAINSTRVDGGRVEPAAKQLREQTYKDPAVVTKSRSFVCVIVYSDAAGAEFDELRARFDVGTNIVSPQHIFAFHDGAKIERREYWSFRAGQESVDALIAMMDRALASHAAKTGAPAAVPPPAVPTPAPVPGAEPGKAEPAPAAEAARAAWLAGEITKIREMTDPALRAAAVRELVGRDQAGDCVVALCALCLEEKKDVSLRIAIVRAVGRPGMEGAVPTLVQLIDDKHDDLRSNAIVSLEYIGSASACEPLSKHLPKEKEEKIRSNTSRALGRCGAKQEWVRKALVRELQTAKADATFAGAAIGLAHFPKDADAARALEKEIKKAGTGPKRGFSLWSLTEIMDPKSADFVKKEVLEGEKNQWVLPWVSAVYNVLSGNGGADSKNTVDGGMSFVVGSIAGGIADNARRDRGDAGYTPKCEFEGRAFGGRGGPGGAPGGPGGMGG